MNTTSPKSRFAKFLDQFAIGVENEKGAFQYVKWHGNVGYISLGARTVARIELSEFGYQGNWSGFVVTITDGINGKVDTCNFHFHDYFDARDRVDTRVKDHPNQAFYAWSSNGGEVDWYIAKPKSPKPIASAINDHLKFWQGHRP